MRIDGDWTASTFHGALDGNATTATALTSNAGGTEQPIYFTGGKPAATSYALKATVNNGNSPYVAYYSGDREISSAKSTNSMIMPSHYYHNLYSDNPTTGTTVYVHYYNGGTTSTNTTANLRVKSGSSYKVLSFSGDGNCSWQGHFEASGGYLKSTANSNTVTIGSQNNGFCHIYNSANIPFIFNQDIQMIQGKRIGGAGTQYRPFQLYLGRYTTTDSKALNSTNPLIEFSNSDRSQYAQLVYTDFNNQGGSDSFTFVSNQNDLRVYAPKVHNAVWNDYAETRATDITEPGRVVTENGKIMTLANERLLPGCRIISDTYGTCMGREEDTPIAVSGRVLVYPYRNCNDYPLGAAVCSAPNGTVDIMTREEIINYPERIIGTVSEIPNYEYWGAGQDGKLQIAVNNRIWIYVR